MRGAEPRLQRTLLAWLLGPMLLLLALDTGATWWSALRSADLAHDRSLHEIARELGLHVTGGPGGPRLELSPAAERILLVDPEDRLFFRVATREGVHLGGEPQLAPDRPLPSSPGSTMSYRTRLDGEPVRVFMTWTPLSDGGKGAVLVQVAETLNRRNALAREIVAYAVLPQLLLIGLVTIAIWLGVARGLRPLNRLRDALARRSHRHLRPIAMKGMPAEIRPLVEEVNDLMRRLGQTLDSQSRFIADAAHQLKTPVSGLKAQLEMALRETDPQRVQHSLAQLYLGVDRMSRLVQQLLALARNEPAAAESLRLQPLDLVAFALEVSMEWAPLALRRNIDLGFEGLEQPLGIRADFDRLRDLLNNLIDNAVRYSREGGRVTVKVVEEPGQAKLSVSDDGPHIPPDERTRVFERFHRMLGAPAEGSGLGLAIVSEIATLHGARITLEEDTDGEGNTFSVWFPLPASLGGAAVS
ncbi:MAG TPA: sensor histidine kinase N-terminal domain-containing protein [Ramlibacter sp.]|nr:sensor histidine kinase N-terminal domain-containing protein [Ramlibacter sp.]